MKFFSIAAQISPAEKGAAVTPSDSTEVNFRALYVGTLGTIVVEMEGPVNITFVGAQGFMPIQVTKVLSTGTTAANIVGLV